jgi:hypothetical protein
LYSDKQPAVGVSRSARDSLQLTSRPLRAAKFVSTNLTSITTEVTINVVPLGSFLRWLSSTAGYVPGNEAWISPSDMAHHQRVLSSGCYPFLSGRSGKPSGLPWQTFRPQRKASIATANRSAFALSQDLTIPFADPLAGLDGRNLRDAESYTENDFFDQLFVCFIFRRSDSFLLVR